MIAALAVGGADAPAASLLELERVLAPREQLRRTFTAESNGAAFERFRQYVGGVPVLGAEAVLTDLPGTQAALLIDDTRGGIEEPAAPHVSRHRAVVVAAAVTALRELRRSAVAELAILPSPSSGRLVWRVLLPAASPVASFEVLVDARTSDVVRVRDLLLHATGTARLFDPNPIERQGSATGLADSSDADSPLLMSLRTPLDLLRLADVGACAAAPFALTGQWVRARLPGNASCTGGLDFSAVTRQDDRFEALMAYAHIDRVQAYVQSLGFTNVLNSQQAVLANFQPEADNSFYDPTTHTIGLGSGGTDDGEDADVIVHEYGHAIQDSQVPGFGQEEGQAGAMGEGFADYLAATISATFTPGTEFDVCLAEWDAFGFLLPSSCLRRTDGDPTASQVLGPPCSGEVHCAGEAWSSALWDIRAELGGQAADRLVVQSHFSLTPTADFHDGSRALLAADVALHGGTHQTFLRQLLIGRGLLDAERLDDTPADAVPLAVPGAISGTLVSSSDVADVYRVSLSAAKGISASLTGAADFDLRLYAPGATSLQTGSVVASSTTPGTSNEVFSYVPSASADYVLAVSAVSGAGAYTLTVARLDRDGDGDPDDQDNCPLASNPGQEDVDGDGLGDVCDRFAQDAANDADGDGRGANEDNCPLASNPGQEDLDGDRLGDVCDRFSQDAANDADGDGIGAERDNCPLATNANQANWDRDGRGDRCDRDALVRLTRLLVQRSLVLVRGQVRPGDLELANVRAFVERRVCQKRRCQYRRWATARGASMIGKGRIELALRLRREGQYRLRLELVDPRYERAVSKFVSVTVGR